MKHFQLQQILLFFFKKKKKHAPAQTATNFLYISILSEKKKRNGVHILHCEGTKIGAHSSCSPSCDRPLDRGTRRCQDASCKAETRVATSQHVFISRRAGCHSCALGAFLRRTADAHASLAMSLFLFPGIMKNQRLTIWIFFFFFKQRAERRQQQRERRRVSPEESGKESQEKKSFKALTWPFLQRSAHMLVPSPPLISTW